MARWQEPMDLDYLDQHRAPVNAKGHAEEEIAASVSRFGFIEALVLDERTGVLLGGHGRLDQLRRRREAGEAPPEGIEVGDSGEWLVPVQRGWNSRDDAEASAAAIALNRLVERGGWDERALLDQLAPFRENGGLSGTGYGAGDLDVLLRQLTAIDAPPLDAHAEWAGMPEFEQADLTSKHQIVVHFKTEEDRVAFVKMLGNPTIRQNSVWWPESDGHVGMDCSQEYVAD